MGIIRGVDLRGDAMRKLKSSFDQDSERRAGDRGEWKGIVQKGKLPVINILVSKIIKHS